MDYNVEYLKKIIEQKCEGFCDNEKIYILNKITNAIRTVKTYNINGFNLSILNHNSVEGKYKETIKLASGKVLTFGFYYD